MEISEQQFKNANARGKALRASLPSVVKARYDRRSARVVMWLTSGLQVAFLPGDVQGLENAGPDELSRIEISPSGLGLHFPDLDADLYVPALLNGFFGSQRWMSQQSGRLGGQAATPAKQEAARKNGGLGGRPRKVASTAA